MKKVVMLILVVALLMTTGCQASSSPKESESVSSTVEVLKGKADSFKVEKAETLMVEEIVADVVETVEEPVLVAVDPQNIVITQQDVEIALAIIASESEEETVEVVPTPTPEPVIEVVPTPTPEPEVEVEPEPTPEPEVEAEPEPTPEPEVEAEPEPTPEPEIESEPEPTPEPEVEAEPEVSNEMEAAPVEEEKVVVDLTEKLDKLMRKNAAYLKKIEAKYGYAVAAVYYYLKVTDGGDWDIKRTNEWKFEKGVTYVYQGVELRMDDPGNIHFGYVGAVIFSEEFVCFGAGFNNFMKFGFRDGDFSSYFDDPQDQEMMRWGHRLYKQGY